MNFLAIMVASLLVSCYEAIENGIPLVIHRVPFVVRLEGQNLTHGVFTTTGILVHPKFVLLSARRCHRKTSFVGYVGFSTRQTADNGNPADSTQYIHPEYKDFSNAFCILRFQKPFHLSPTVQVAELTGQPEAIPDELLVAGWGHDITNGTDTKDSEFLRAAITSVYKNCMQEYKPEYVTDSVLCIGKKDRNHKTVLGDEGGPIYSPYSNKVYGMVVNYFETLENDKLAKPTLANSIAWGRDWIMETIFKSST